ncbi:hypothetical protein AWR38_01035 [Idiomarina sp. WRN-38]|nr:hypothetical protein AUR68_01030 [Idiomarina sp. H105]OAE96011.1 hypothetical protein AWR38_01035 [Idiomarina sp. WRN-38]
MRLAKQKWDQENKDRALAYGKAYREENKEQVLEASRKWYRNNKERASEYTKKRRAENPEKFREWRRSWYERKSEHAKEYAQEWRRNNPGQCYKKKQEWIERNKDRYLAWRRNWWHQNSDRLNAERNRARSSDNGRYAEYQRDWYSRAKHREEVKIKKAWRGVLWHFLQLAKQGKDGATHELLGYTPDDLRAHIERQFTKGMSWENHGEWHIDHIIPLAEHVKNGVTDPAVANCLTNLRPIWAKDNLRKKAKKTHLI